MRINDVSARVRAKRKQRAFSSPSCVGGSDALLYHTQWHVGLKIKEPKQRAEYRDPLLNKPTEGYLAAKALLESRQA